MNAKEATIRAKGTWSGSYGVAACPVCQPEKRADQKALTIRQSGGRLYMKCHKSDCHIRDIKAALGGAFVDTKPDAAKEAQERERRRRSEQAGAAHARKLMDLAKAARHPYLAGKGLPDRVVPVIPLGVARKEVYHPRPFQHLSHDAPILLVPVTDLSRNLTSLQMIGPDGSKAFMAGGRMGGCGARIAISGSPGQPMRTVLCEGYATGLSIAMAARAIGRPLTVWCALSANNMVALIKNGLDAHCVVADNDPSETGIRAAKETGLPFAAPQTVGEDFNDLWQRSPDEAGRILKDLLARARS